MRPFPLIESLRRPLVLAPMAGGPSSAELVAAASEAGALGSIGAAYTKPKEIGALVAGVRALTRKPIALNLFTPAPPAKIDPRRIAAALEATRSIRAELGLSPPRVTPPFEPDFGAQFEAALHARPEALSFVFGIPDRAWLKAARDAGIYLIGTATTLEEALAAADAGFDAITVQGVEAGGHRGTFDVAAEDPNLSTRELLRACAGHIHLPMIAAGGIMTAADVREMRALGARAVQMGTAFLACREAGTSAPWRSALIGERRTVLTRAFSGRLARGIENRFVREVREHMPYPAQNAFTRDIRNAALARGTSDYLSLWCGAGVGELWTGSARELIEFLFPGP